MSRLQVSWHINAVRVPLNEHCLVGVETNKIQDQQDPPRNLQE